MRPLLQIISVIALSLTVFPSLMFFAGMMELDRMKWLMMAATVAWFIATPLWMGREKENPPATD
ncbi:MAG: hypothetical protein JXM70_21520 [Pirellulales bacterium]|nr:hypothetical protein [Pirellulales bacterium]